MGLKKVSNVQIEGCESVVCHRPKSNSKVIRNSGGVILYYKQEYSNVIEISSINNVGIIWFKIKKAFTCSDDDQYVTLCYIPPDKSTFYTNNNSILHEFAFIELV